MFIILSQMVILKVTSAWRCASISPSVAVTFVVHGKNAEVSLQLEKLGLGSYSAKKHERQRSKYSAVPGFLESLMKLLLTLLKGNMLPCREGKFFINQYLVKV